MYVWVVGPLTTAADTHALCQTLSCGTTSLPTSNRGNQQYNLRGWLLVKQPCNRYLAGYAGQLCESLFSTGAEHCNHGLQVRLVKSGHDCASPWLPSLQVCWDKPLAHNGLQDLCQDALVIVECILLHTWQVEQCFP